MAELINEDANHYIFLSIISKIAMDRQNLHNFIKCYQVHAGEDYNMLDYASC